MKVVQFKRSSSEKEVSSVSSMTVFNTEEVDTKKQPMFFGKPLGVQRYDTYKYPAFENWDISGDLKRYPFRKIVVIIKIYVQSRSISLLLI